ncbi:AgmX/PglI C-terminal domain-containing protein [Sorangium cellulosum]|uniref:AgmX/PglI C-terminal domain-containing protein n=1 Tax=Sorangium cellulosum TaxID=56 RepID=UPI003D9A58B5
MERGETPETQRLRACGGTFNRFVALGPLAGALVSGALACSSGGPVPPPELPKPSTAAPDQTASSTIAEPGPAPAPSAGAPVSSATAAQPPLRGRLPPETIRAVVRDNFTSFRACYEKALAKDPKLEGRVAVRFLIDRDGSVAYAGDADAPIQLAPGTDASIGEKLRQDLEFERFAREATASPPGKPMPDKDVVRCVIAGFRELKFPVPEGGRVTVVYPIVFAPSD